MQLQASRYRRKILYGFKFTPFLLLLWVVSFNMTGCSATYTTNTPETDPVDIPLLENWSGNYPVSELGRLPEGQHDMATGYIGDTETFIPIWRAFMPEEEIPPVDFSKNITVFTRNVQFYNRTSILKVTLHEGTADIIAMETMSALPIEEKVAMAMAVIPRDGIMAIRAGTEKVEVKNHK